MEKTKMAITYAIIAAALGLALSTSLITSALAANPHFVGTPTCTTSSGTDTKFLTCTGRIAGLGNVGTEIALIGATVIVPCAGLPFLPTAPFPITSNGETTFTATLSFGAECPIPPHVTFENIIIGVEGIRLPIPGIFDP